MKENFINYLPLKAYRYLCWFKNEKKIYRYNKKHFTKRYADICYLAEKLRYEKKSQSQILDAYAKKDAYILNYLEKLLSDVIGYYKKDNYNLKVSSTEPDKKKVWIFWWTGIEGMPEIVKACVKSIRRNIDNHEIVMLDKSNYYRYITLPEIIIDKHEKGVMGHAHFSDIVRFSLLAVYGGMWIDATVFLSQPIPPNIFSMKWYTLRSYDTNAVYYSKSRWCGYFIEGDSDFLLFPFVRDCLIAYWKRKNEVIDYLMMDYVIGLACKYIDDVRERVDSLPDNNVERGRLMRELNEPYSEVLFESLYKGNTFASKLSWRYGKPSVRTIDGRLSNYGYLLSLNEEEET